MKHNMSEKVQDFSAQAMIGAMEANLFEFFRTFGRWPEAEVHDDPDMLWTITDIRFPLFNSVLRARLETDKIDASIEATLSRFKARNVPMLWWTGPATSPKTLGVLLEAHGLKHELDSPGMAADLHALNEDLPQPDLKIELVDDAESLRMWSQIVTTGFAMPSFVADALFDFCLSVGFGASPVRNYYGLLKGETVTASTLFLGAGVAGLYNVATLPAARRQGVGTAITLETLREARALGYRNGVLFSSELGVGVYRKLGFQEYCKIGHYVWQ